MTAGNIIKRTFQSLGCLFLLGVISLAGLYSYIDNSPGTQKELLVSLEAVEHRVDEDSGFFERLGVLVTAWWNSEEHYAEKQREDELEAKAKAARRQAEEERRFNNTVPSSENDYYAESTARD